MSRPRTGHTKRVDVRVSPALLTLVEKAAKREGVALTEWFRSAALLKLARAGDIAILPPAALRAAVAHLPKVNHDD